MSVPLINASRRPVPESLLEIIARSRGSEDLLDYGGQPEAYRIKARFDRHRKVRRTIAVVLP